MMVSYHWASSLEQRSSAEMQIKMSLTIYTLVRLVSAMITPDVLPLTNIIIILFIIVNRIEKSMRLQFLAPHAFY